MLIPIGFFGGTKADTGSFDLLATTLLSTTATSVTFDVSTYAALGYKHLQIRATGRNSGEDGNLLIKFNSDTGSNYTRHALYGDGTGVYSNAGTSQTNIQIGAITLNSDTASNFGANVIDILDGFSSSKYKTIRSLSGRTGNNQILLRSGAWMSTSAITSVTVLTNANNFVTGSRFSIYGVK